MRNHRSRIFTYYMCGNTDWLCRNIIQDMLSTLRTGSLIPEADPYIPFSINPSGMQPVLTTAYVLSTPGIITSVVNSPFWERLKDVLNPENSIGAKPWVYYAIFTFFVFIFNIFDIGNIPKEISAHLNKIGARIPAIRPGMCCFYCRRYTSEHSCHDFGTS